MAPYTVHARIVNLASTVSISALGRFLERGFPGTNPIIHDLVFDNNNSQSGTICFQAKSKKAARKALEAYKSKERILIDDVGCLSHVGIDESCQDLIKLRIDHREPQFEYARVFCYPIPTDLG